MLACFAVIGTIASITRKFVSAIRTQAIGYFIFEKLKIPIDDLIITLFLKTGRFSQILCFKRVLNSCDSVTRNNKTMTKSFFLSSWFDWIFSESFIKKIFFWHNYLSIWCSFLIFLLNDKLLNEILKIPKQLKMLKIIKWKSNQFYMVRKWSTLKHCLITVKPVTIIVEKKDLVIVFHFFLKYHLI